MIPVAKFTVQNNTSSDLTDVQVRAEVSNPDFFDAVPDPDKMELYDPETGNPVPFYVFSWDTLNKTAVIWMKIASLPANGTKDVYVYFNPARTTPLSDPFGVFIFYDGFEVWEGWIQHGQGKVEQSANYAYKGKYSLLKTYASDPNGGIKAIGTTIDFPFVLEMRVRRQDYNGGNADRIGVVDDNGNGYGFVNSHNPTSHNCQIQIDKRESYSGYPWSGYTIPFDIYQEWYTAKFIWNNGQLASIIEFEGKTYSYTYSDSTYSSFTHVYVFGGYDYYVDEMWIYKYVDPAPTVTLTVGKKTSIEVKDDFGNVIPVGFLKLGEGKFAQVNFPYEFYTLLPVQAIVYVPSYQNAVITVDPNSPVNTAVVVPVLQPYLDIIRKLMTNRMKLEDGRLIVFDDDNTTPLEVFLLLDKEGRPTVTDVYDKIPQNIPKP